MKRIFAVALVLALIFVVGASLTAMAAGPSAGQGPQAAGQDCPNFVDEDGDGICDLCPNGGVRAQDGTGQQMRRGGQGAHGTGGANFVDEDGDGVCDNCANGGMRPQDGTGQQMRRGGAHGGGHGRR